MRLSTGGFVVLAVAASTAAKGTDKAAEEALSQLLLDRHYMSHEPIPGGLDGAYTNPRQVVFSQPDPCVFRFYEDGLNENGDRGTDWRIDFNNVTAIHVERVDRPDLDPAVARLYRIEPAKGKAVRITIFADPDPLNETLCRVKMCGGRSLSFLQPAAHLEHARQAAVDFRKYCPGPPKRAP